MESLIEKMYDEIFNTMDKYMDKSADREEFINCDKKTSALLKEFKAYVPLAQMDLFDKLWRSVLDGNYPFGLMQFKAGFKIGLKLACECFKV